MNTKIERTGYWTHLTNPSFWCLLHYASNFCGGKVYKVAAWDEWITAVARLV